jgi:outer membrane receptor protein involved in Fe transport
MELLNAFRGRPRQLERLMSRNRFLRSVAFAFVCIATTDVGYAQQGAAVEEVTVTGSRIARPTSEGATSVVAIQSDDLDALGFRNVFDALAQQTQNTGFVQGADFGNTFTPAANAISLRDLGPNHALVLVDGRRVADYPTAYEGEVNFVNLANIPSAAIDRIEILNAGASAIYGSDAIAGVVNLVLKKHVEGVELGAKIGATDRGNGENWRFQATGGHTFLDRLETVAAIELSHTDRIWSRDRDFMSSTTREGEAPTVVWSRRNLDTNRYIAPGTTCDLLADTFDRSVVLSTTKAGPVCGSGKAQPSYWTTKTENSSQNLYVAANYAFNEHAVAYASAIAGWNDTRNNTRGPSWTSDAANNGFFLNATTGNYEVWTKRISPEEIGGATRFDRKWEDTSTVLTAGLRGRIADNTWTYDVSFSSSSYQSRNTRPRLLRAIDDYYLGPQLGADPDGIAIFAPDAARFAAPLTPAQFDSLVGKTRSHDRSWLQTLSASATGELFDLPAGAVKASALVEYGRQGFSNNPDPLLNQNLFYNTLPADRVSGSRSRYAGSAELRIPVIEPLTTTLAARYDDYSFAGRSDGKLTYNAALEYRPVRSLLLRGNYATSFRAPDMSYIFQTQVRGYYSSTTDYYRCALAQQPLSDCEFANVSPGSNYLQSGNRELGFENGKSFGYGLVLSPAEGVDVSVDYWRISIDDLVTNLDADTLLRIEADCRSGNRVAGSAECADALRRIQRNPADATLNPNAITNILIDPINAAEERVSGVDVGGNVAWSIGDWGDLLWRLNYTKVLSHRYQQFASDVSRDELHALDNTDWRDKAIVSVTWSLKKLDATLQVTRYGRVPNAAQTAYLTPTSLANLSLHYQLNRSASVGFIVNNVLDEIKDDDSFGWPYYPVGNYSPYGREAWLEVGYRFGS